MTSPMISTVLVPILLIIGAYKKIEDSSLIA
jgi:hypothetical protein